MIEKESEALEIAYDEARTIIDFQLDVAERLEQEIQKTIRLNLLILGIFFPILRFSIEEFGNEQNFSAFLPWVSLSALFIFAAIFFSVVLHRSRLYYGGYEDSPDVNFESITGRKVNSTRDRLSQENDLNFTSEKNFYMNILFDFSKGIRHNNKETDYRKLVLTRIEHVMIAGIFYLFIGIFIIFVNDVPSVLESLEHLSVFLISFLLGSYVIYSAIKTTYSFRLRGSDPIRLSASDFEFHADRSDRGFPND